MGKNETMKTGKRLTVGENITYSIGSLGRELSNNCINVFFLVYLNVYMHLDAGILTLAFVLAKVWDTINDPMLATLINNTKQGRHGRYRPWIAIGALLNALVIIAMFTPIETSNIALKYFYYITMYVLWGMTFTVVDVPFWSMIPTIANSTDERNRVSSFAKLIGGFGGFLISSVGTSLILPNLAHKGMKFAYFILGITASMLMFACLMVTVIGNREKYLIPNEKVGLKQIHEMFKQNDQLRAYAISYVLFVSATTIALFQILYIFVYCYEDAGNFFNSKFSYTMFWAISCTGQGIAMIFYSLIVKKIPREKIYGANYIFASIGLVLMFFIFFAFQPGKYWLNTILIALAGAFLMMANGLNQIGSTVMIADVVDYGEWKTGKRGDSIIFSVQTLLLKFAGVIAMLILGIGIKAAKLPEIYERFNEATGAMEQYFMYNGVEVTNIAEYVTGDALTILRVFMFLIPIPLCLIGYWVYKKKYWLYGEKYQKIKDEIDERRKNKTEKGQIENNNNVKKVA